MPNPRAEALDILGGDFEARVLEPSPPAVTEEPYTDDPVAPGEVPEGRRLVSPVSEHGDLTWDDVARERPEIADWCAERWLGAWRPLRPLPDGFAETRVALQRVAEQVMAPARKPDNEIALRYTRGGFGTPFYEQGGQDCQTRVEAGELVVQRGMDEERRSLDGSLLEGLPKIDRAAAIAIGEFFGFACSALEEVRAEQADEEPSLVQLWPEHFDIAFELGLESRGRRANFGASPGDDEHDQPYLYVGPWDTAIAEAGPEDVWNAGGFPGAEITYDELITAPDQRRVALDFFAERRKVLCGP